LIPFPYPNRYRDVVFLNSHNICHAWQIVLCAGKIPNTWPLPFDDCLNENYQLYNYICAHVVHQGGGAAKSPTLPQNPFGDKPPSPSLKKFHPYTLEAGREWSNLSPIKVLHWIRATLTPFVCTNGNRPSTLGLQFVMGRSLDVISIHDDHCMKYCAYNILQYEDNDVDPALNTTWSNICWLVTPHI
jgi:hypothetical protein